MSRVGGGIVELQNGARLEIKYKNGATQFAVVDTSIRHVVNDGMGEPYEDFAYPTISVEINGFTGQLLLDESFIREVDYVRLVK